jgi:sugar phosphate permease
VTRRWGRLYYGWIIVLALSLAEPVSWGVQYYAIAVFLRPMEADLGWSRTTMAGAYSLALVVSGLAAFPVGRWLDRHGPRGLMTVGSIAAALLILAWSRVESLTAYYLIWVGLGLTMAATLYEPAFVAVANWFVRNRGRALTILTFGGGWASAIFIPLADWLVRTHGWRTALVLLALILAAVTIPLHALLRRRPSDLGLTPDGWSVGAPRPPQRSVSLRRAVRDAAFW